MQCQRRGAVTVEQDRRRLAFPLPPADLFRRLGDQGTRSLPLRIDALELARFELRIVLPDEGLRCRSLPQDLVIQSFGLACELRWRSTGNAIELVRRVAIRPALVPPGEFAAFVQALRRADQAEEARVELVGR